MTLFSVSYGVGLTFSFILDILSLMWMDLEGHNLNNFGIQQLTNYYGHLDTASEGSSDTGSYLLPNMILDAEQFLWGCEKRREFRVTTKNFFLHLGIASLSPIFKKPLTSSKWMPALSSRQEFLNWSSWRVRPVSWDKPTSTRKLQSFYGRSRSLPRHWSWGTTISNRQMK